jgi:hypothetical protein
MSKLFTVAGVSLHKGKYSVRYANSASRAGVLARNGHTDILLYEFAEALAKEDCVDLLLKFDLYDFNTEQRAAIQGEAHMLGFIV